MAELTSLLIKYEDKKYEKEKKRCKKMNKIDFVYLCRVNNNI